MSHVNNAFYWTCPFISLANKLGLPISSFLNIFDLLSPHPSGCLFKNTINCLHLLRSTLIFIEASWIFMSNITSSQILFENICFVFRATSCHCNFFKQQHQQRIDIIRQVLIKQDNAAKYRLLFSQNRLIHLLSNLPYGYSRFLGRAV